MTDAGLDGTPISSACQGITFIPSLLPYRVIYIKKITEKVGTTCNVLRLRVIGILPSRVSFNTITEIILPFVNSGHWVISVTNMRRKEEGWKLKESDSLTFIIT